MYQFYHFDTYSLNSTKNRRSLYAVCQEFMRDPTAIPHVEKPLTPIIRYGIDFYEAERTIRERVAKARDKKGRKIRKDALVCVSSVVSFPKSLQEENPELYEDWVQRNIEYFRFKHGNNFLSCIEHLDEENPHLHVGIAIADTAELGGASIDAIHRPLRKKNQEKGMKAKSLAYVQACREEQDDYYNNVSIFYGLQRTGPGRKRLKRKEYMTAKREAELLAETLRANEQKEANLTVKEEKLAVAEDRVIKNAKYIMGQRENLKQLEKSVNQTSEDILKFENNYLRELDKSNPRKVKDFYNKRVSELKNK
ncbi:plasmid recombination protein, partial [Vibrio pomeroyi]